MLKQIVVIAFLLLVIGISAMFWMKEYSSAQLVGPINVKEEKGDFILHVRVDNMENGVEVLSSLEYSGKDSVTLNHRTPLTAVSFHVERNDFTGSPVSKQMDPGDIYHPQPPVTFTSLGKGTYRLYIHSQFFVKGKPINITTEKEIIME
ncbi:hypothetical protein [Aquibacillus albus]|uniref:YtkA-like domain-containing protein n=1 Tax=Aquibacillus albus TaxID=1168171 RepID=A0ABS2N246_9BACI|nr:hypothetical protein [Aquibacillus albus]MBM7572192.1 hypothetical protein [Aquibacillus albus]